MRRRAEQIGAELTQESAPGAGTAVSLAFETDAGGWTRNRMNMRWRRDGPDRRFSA